MSGEYATTRIVNTSKPDLSNYTVYDDEGRKPLGWITADSMSDRWTWTTVFGTAGEHVDRSQAIIDCSKSVENSKKGKKA